MANTQDIMNSERSKLANKVKTLLNSELKAVLKEESLLVSGNKAVLQERIIEHIDNAIAGQDYSRFREIHRTINRHGHGHNLPLPEMSGTSYPAPSAHHQHHAMPRPTYTHAPLPAHSHSHSPHTSLSFKRSPFYEPLEQLTNTVILPIVTSSRHTGIANISLTQDQIARMASDSSLRIMVYCGLEMEHSPKDITFPAQIDLKCNNESFSGNLRGIKKKPGTTKPADITPFLRKQAGFRNVISLAYAGTDKKFQALAYLVRRHSVENLVGRIKRGQTISKQTVLNEMISKAKDPDIVATSTIMSLKCPLSAMRMELPCRSTVCNHNQCYDATSFLQLQEQAPQWSCPVCNKTFQFQSLVVDQYVQDILTSTSSDVEQVTIEPDGRWQQGVHTNNDFRAPSSRPSAASSNKRKASDVFDLDGGVEIVEKTTTTTPIVNRNRHLSTPQAYPTPSFTTSREPSTAASTSSGSAGKLPAEPVIDLTLSSDDEDDDPVQRRPIKRQSTGSTISAVPTLQTQGSSVLQSGQRSTPTSATEASRPSWMTNAAGQWPSRTSVPTPGLSVSAYRLGGPYQQAQSPQYSPGYQNGYPPHNATWGYRSAS